MTVNSENSKIPGYFVESTAPIEVNEERGATPKDLMKIFEFNENGYNPQKDVNIQQIVEKLLASSNPELIISVHGYNNSLTSTKKRYASIYQWINTSPNISHTDGKVYLGYRWPSEDTAKLQWKNAFKALPILPSWIFFTGLAFSVILCFALFFLNPNWFLGIPLVLSVALFTIILTFILMRLSAYFRDSYRAINYGVPDLVELIRRLDQAAFVKVKVSENNWKTESALRNSRESQDRQRIKLTFIGHSLGGLVVTNTIRVLSDVFDPKSIGESGVLSSSDSQKLPDEGIGRVFCLGRLVLIAPDIPVETIIPRRANFLRSSLRRFEEAYIFSNEGDMILRIASTIANYFSFPASDRLNGYRLGTLTVKHFKDTKDTKGFSPKHGIVNLRTQDGVGGTTTQSYTFQAPYECLEIRSSNREHASLEEVRSLKEIAGKPVANLITYFDCTDYVDSPGGKGILSHAKKQPALILKDYIPLTLETFSNKKNVHGGYFDGKFSQQVIYQLAFLGFKGFLNTFPPSDVASDELTEPELLEKKLLQFHKACQEKQIQVILAPERYSVDILKQKRDRSGY